MQRITGRRSSALSAYERAKLLEYERYADDASRAAFLQREGIPFSQLAEWREAQAAEVTSPIQQLRDWPEERQHVVVLAVGLMFCALVRFVILVRNGAPATIDGGNWLAFGNSFFGDHIRSRSLSYPPGVPMLVAILRTAMGPVAAIGVMGAVSSVMPSVGVYALVRRWNIGWLGVAAALLFAPASSTGEAVAWGGFPQLIGLGLTPLVLLAVDASLRSGTWRDARRAGLLLALTMVTSHFVLSFLVLAIVILALVRLAETRHDLRAFPPMVVPVGLTMAAATILCAPFLLPVLSSIGSNVDTKDTQTTLSVANLVSALEFPNRDFEALWRPLLAVGVLASPLLFRRRGEPWRMATALAGALVLGSLATRQIRFVYFAPLAGVIGASAIFASTYAWRSQAARHRVSIGLAAGVLALQSALGLHFFIDQRDFYGIVTPGMYKGMQWLRTNTAPGATLAVSSVDDAPLGWWFEGEVRRRTIYASPLRWLSFDDEIARAQVANSVFASRAFPSTELFQRLSSVGCDYVVVSKQSARFRPEAFRAFINDSGRRPVFQNEAVLIFRITT